MSVWLVVASELDPVGVVVVLLLIVLLELAAPRVRRSRRDRPTRRDFRG